MDFISKRLFIVKQFHAMGASSSQLVEETIKLFSKDTKYFDEWWDWLKPRNQIHDSMID